jgi:hypothetical protein
MLELLRELTKSVDTIVILGSPNLRFFFKLGLDEGAVIYRGSTDECRIVIPIRVSKDFEKFLPSRCEVVKYSYDSYPLHSYVITKSFSNTLIGVLKSFAKPGEELGVPLNYVDTPTYLALSKFWRLRDLSKDIRVLRYRKEDTMVRELIELYNIIKKIVEMCRSEGLEVERCILVKALDIFNYVGLGLLNRSSDFVTFRITLDKPPYILNYRWTIALSKKVEDVVKNIGDHVEKVSKNYYSKPCLDLVRNLKSQLQRQGYRVWVDICGVGTEFCEYPSLSECLYENVVIDSGAVVQLEVVVDETIYVPKLIVVRNRDIEVY